MLRVCEQKKVSPIEKLSTADKVKVLGALITRIEEGAAEGDQFSASVDDSGSTADTKRELVRYVQCSSSFVTGIDCDV